MSPTEEGRRAIDRPVGPTPREKAMGVVAVLAVATGVGLIACWLFLDVTQAVFTVGLLAVIAGGWGLERSGHKTVAGQLLPALIDGLMILFGIGLVLSFGRLAFTLDTLFFRAVAALLAVAIAVALTGVLLRKGRSLRERSVI